MTKQEAQDKKHCKPRIPGGSSCQRFEHIRYENRHILADGDEVAIAVSKCLKCGRVIRSEVCFTCFSSIGKVR